MANYLLPCSCGRTVGVSTSMAGEMVRCACGAELAVPTLRGLRQLAEADDSAAAPSRRARVWTDRHRVTFVLAVIAAAATCLAAYLALTRPGLPMVRSLHAGPLVTDSSSPSQVYAVLDELKKGIRPKTNVITPEAKEAIEQRTRMTWGIRIALGVGACALVAAVVSAFVPGGKKSGRMS